jgi:hypothetical protein
MKVFPMLSAVIFATVVVGRAVEAANKLDHQLEKRETCTTYGDCVSDGLRLEK